MASPFVPVDLDKLLDEFEEKEEETKPEQLASFGTSTSDRKQVTEQSFQVRFPSIEEEVLSDQGSDRRILDDKSDGSSDRDSISEVIEATEAITNQQLSPCKPQTTQGLAVDDNLSDKLEENVAIVDFAPTGNLELDGNNDLNINEDSNSVGFDLNEEKRFNQYGHVQSLNEETESVTVPADFNAPESSAANAAPSDVSYITETETRNAGDELAPSILCTETSSELHDENITVGATDQERQWTDEIKFNTERSGVDVMDQYNYNEMETGVADDVSTPDVLYAETNKELTDEHVTIGLTANEGRHWTDEKDLTIEGSGGSSMDQYDAHVLLDSAFGLSEPAVTSRVPEDADTGVYLAEVNQATDNPGSLGEHNVPHGAVVQEEELTSNGNVEDGHSAEPDTVSEISQDNTVLLPDSAYEATSEPSWTPEDNDSDLNVNSHGATCTVLSQDQSDTVQLDQPGTSNVSMASDSETYLNSQEYQAPDNETQAISDNQGEEVAQSVPSQGEASTDYNQIYDADALETGTPPLSNELESGGASEPDLTITMHSQGSLEAQRITAGEANLGKVPPLWVPDSAATHCMNCGLKFTVIKRRHHCRACGKALCSSCCNMKFLLPYMDNKEGRVCQVCCNALLRAQALQQVAENQTNEHVRRGGESPTEDLMLDDGLEEDEELPVDQEETVEGAEAMADEDTTDFAGAVGVDVTSEHTAPVLPPLQIPVAPPADMAGTPLSTPTSPALSDDSDCLFRLDLDNVRSLLPQDITALPPVLKVINEEISIQERPDPAEIMYQLKGLHETVVFLLNKNLVVKVSIVKLSCCVKRKCWCFVTEGMGAANQEEMVVLLECLRKETMLPKDVLSHFNTAFAYAKQGHTVSELGYTIFGQPFLGSSDNAGFLYVKPTYQCLKNLPLPSTPYVVGILIKRSETPWAQLFPLRLQLRLGAEYRYYPCPLFSSRNRSPVYGEVGHTIMNLLADFKNFQYTLGRVTGLVIHMEEKRTLVRLPQDRYDEVVKILNATDEHVMALGANFSLQADSHLVCIQSEQGYKTQAINIQNQARKVTGASFIVFSGALKTSSPFTAKVSIVEDGIMVQLMPEVIGKLRNSLKEMKDYTITTGIPGGGEEEQVIIEWVSRKDAPRQSSLCSPIDGLQLDGFPSVKVHSGCDFTRKNVFRIQWTEMFFVGEGQQSASRDVNKLTAELAKAFCRTLMPHLSKLSSDNCTFLGLRVNLDRENVGYLTGSNQQSLPSNIMADLDNVLVPVIHAAAGHHRGRALSVELLFKVLRLL